MPPSTRHVYSPLWLDSSELVCRGRETAQNGAHSNFSRSLHSRGAPVTNCGTLLLQFEFFLSDAVTITREFSLVLPAFLFLFSFYFFFFFLRKTRCWTDCLASHDRRGPRWPKPPTFIHSFVFLLLLRCCMSPNVLWSSRETPDERVRSAAPQLQQRSSSPPGECARLASQPKFA